jgi:hypothetical protein
VAARCSGWQERGNFTISEFSFASRNRAFPRGRDLPLLTTNTGALLTAIELPSQLLRTFYFLLTGGSREVRLKLTT